MRRERPERAASSQPRATPWVPGYKALRPVRAKVWANGWLLLLPLQGVGNGNMVPRALPWALDLLGFQPAQGRPYVPNLRRQRPFQGLIFRVGACPYLLEPIYEPRPCKGLISRQMLRGKPRPRYAPLTGAAARIDELRREIGASPYPGICAPFRGNPPQPSPRAP